MISPTSTAHAHPKLRVMLGAVVVMLLGLLGAPAAVDAQGVQGVQQGAKEGNRAAGPVGGVLGRAIGGVVGGFTGVRGVAKGGQAAPAANGTKQAGSAKPVKGTKAAKQAVLTQEQGEPQLTAEQIVA